MANRTILFHPFLPWSLLKETFAKWNTDRAPRLGASLAYYTVFSIVPLLIMIIAIVGLVFGREAAESYLIAQIAALVGGQSATAIQDMLQRQPSYGWIATVVAFATLLFGASGVFAQLQDALNTIWGVEPKGAAEYSV